MTKEMMLNHAKGVRTEAAQRMTEATSDASILYWKDIRVIAEDLIERLQS